MPVYNVVDLTKLYPKQTIPANDRITLQIEQGEIFGLLGANGAGKTTLVRQLANLLAPTSGTIRLFDQPLARDPVLTTGLIGYMPQDGLALQNLTVGETLYFTAHLRGLSRRDARDERDRLLDLLDLGAARDRIPARISGGQRRLALLATTIAATPPVLLLDEPTNDLDPVHRRHVWDVVRDLKQARGCTILLVTHNVIEAEKVIERVGIMRGGQLIALGRPGALKADLNRQLRLTVTLAPTPSGDQSPRFLPDGTAFHQVAAGRWAALIERDTAPAVLDALNHAPDVEDFALNTATLEDLYLALAEETPA